MNRFPVLAKIFMAVMPSRMEKLTQDTRKHESHTIELIERSTLLVLDLGSFKELICGHRRLKNPSDRPDFLTRILETRDAEEISNIQLAAHASDFVLATNPY